MVEYIGQSKQDEFVIKVLNYKRNGFFLEIGTNDPVLINNTYVLESVYGWRGLMVEYDRNYEESYKIKRKSQYIIQDARLIDYEALFAEYNFPKAMDYLQIDLEVNQNSTLQTLELLDRTIFKNYKFAVVTFEHDIYSGDFFSTREKSREIFLRNGYVMVFQDVKNCGNPYEDWYVHPSLVDMDFINQIKRDASLEWSEIMEIINKVATNAYSSSSAPV